MSLLDQKCRFEHKPSTSGLTPSSDISARRANRRDGPCIDGSGLARRIFTLQRWSERPCVRPVCAVPMTAGHNALRGSGPGQKHAFDDAVARVGCPDRRIDRHCIKRCSSSQPLRHAGCPARFPLGRKRDRFLVALTLAIMAQAILASLLASAIAAILVGRRANNPVSQGRCPVPWILA